MTRTSLNALLQTVQEPAGKFSDELAVSLVAHEEPAAFPTARAAHARSPAPGTAGKVTSRMGACPLPSRHPDWAAEMGSGGPIPGGAPETPPGTVVGPARS